MTHFVTEKCIKCKYTDCVEVCPVDCFYEGLNMLLIDPDQCIDCGVCIPECPIDAIVTDESVLQILDLDDADLSPEQRSLRESYKLNVKYAKSWPQITTKKSAPVDAKKFENEKDKLKYFGENLLDEN